MILKRIWLVICWIFGYRAVFSKEPSHKSLVIYARMNRIVATKKCAVCKKEYWVVGSHKGKLKPSRVCGRLKCYLKYNMNKDKYQKKSDRR